MATIGVVMMLELLAIADEASAGIGFVPRKDGTPISAGVVARHFAALRPGTSTWRAPSTLCKTVPPGQYCVQPKSRTPQVDCTLRSLSHNLALLPAIGEVTTSYYVSPAPMNGRAPNLLLVPFPCEVDDGFVVGGPAPRREGWGHFEVSQTWLPSQSADRVFSFLRALVQSAGSQSGRKVHGVVLPELPLSKADADAVAERLARSGLRIFITGARWSYGLKLDTRVRWWERIDVANRSSRSLDEGKPVRGRGWREHDGRGDCPRDPGWAMGAWLASAHSEYGGPYDGRRSEDCRSAPLCRDVSGRVENAPAGEPRTSRRGGAPQSR